MRTSSRLLGHVRRGLLVARAFCAGIGSPLRAAPLLALRLTDAGTLRTRASPSVLPEANA